MEDKVIDVEFLQVPAPTRREISSDVRMQLQARGALPGDRFARGYGWELVPLPHAPSDKDRLRYLEGQVAELKRRLEDLAGSVYNSQRI